MYHMIFFLFMSNLTATEWTSKSKRNRIELSLAESLACSCMMKFFLSLNYIQNKSPKMVFS